MSNYILSVPQATDLWHCTKIPNPNWVDPLDGSSAPLICQEPYEKLPSNVIKTGENNGNNIYLSPYILEQGSLVGKWNYDGAIAAETVVDSVFDALVPVGNRKGVATEELGYHTYQGHEVRNRQEVTGNFKYPSNNQPFSLRITRTLTTDDAWPHIPWGWTVEMLSEDPLRSIAARAIGIYDSEDNYLYTTGAFILMTLPDNAQRHATVCPVGQRTATAQPIYFKLLLGSQPEGSWSLESLEEGATQTRLFWAGNQPGTEWVDSGQTVDSMAGTVTIIQDNSAFRVGTLVRINGIEMEVTSKWNTTGLVLNPYTASSTGSIMEVWE